MLKRLYSNKNTKNKLILEDSVVSENIFDSLKQFDLIEKKYK